MADDGGDDFGANPPPPRDDKDERMNPEDDNGTNNNSNNHGATVAASNTESFSSAGGGGGAAIGSAAMRPVFLGNLLANYSTDQVTELFERCYQIRGLPREFSKSIAVDRIDVKRGYCFVFLKDAASQGEKETIEDFVVAINGM